MKLIAGVVPKDNTLESTCTPGSTSSCGSTLRKVSGTSILIKRNVVGANKANVTINANTIVVKAATAINDKNALTVNNLPMTKTKTMLVRTNTIATKANIILVTGKGGGRSTKCGEKGEGRTGDVGRLGGSVAGGGTPVNLGHFSGDRKGNNRRRMRFSGGDTLGGSKD